MSVVLDGHLAVDFSLVLFYNFIFESHITMLRGHIWWSSGLSLHSRMGIFRWPHGFAFSPFFVLFSFVQEAFGVYLTMLSAYSQLCVQG